MSQGHGIIDFVLGAGPVLIWPYMLLGRKTRMKLGAGSHYALIKLHAINMIYMTGHSGYIGKSAGFLCRSLKNGRIKPMTLKHWYLSLPSLVLGITSILQGYVSSVPGYCDWLEYWRMAPMAWPPSGEDLQSHHEFTLSQVGTHSASGCKTPQTG